MSGYDNDGVNGLWVVLKVMAMVLGSVGCGLRVAMPTFTGNW